MASNEPMEPSEGRSRRLILILGVLILGVGSAFLTWWTTTLSGLPDAGDPFDVAAFSRPIPDDTNAYILYRKAVALMPPEPAEKIDGDWGTATLAQRDWLVRCGPALDIWREGTRRPAAQEVDPATSTFESRLNTSQSLRNFCRAALLKGGQLEEAGDFEGALDWYMALLRSSRHCGQRGFLIQRLIGMAIYNMTSTRLTRWAAEPKVDAKLLRKALDAAIAAGEATPPTSDAIKAEYLTFIHSIADPSLMAKLHDFEVVTNAQGGATTIFGKNPWKASLTRVGRRALNEPERSRRVGRLIFANWLAYCDLPPSRRPPRVSGAMATAPTGPSRSLLLDLFVVGKEAPAQARTLPPEKLAAWFASTMDARLGLPAFVAFDKAIAREQSTQASLILALANELYKREHGQYPDHIEELVGSYLKALPAEFPTPK